MNSIILNLIYLTLIFFLINILFITVSYKLLIQFILIYFCIFIFLLYLEVNFLALSFFIVYIGAVAILFLFTVLLLGKTQNYENEFKEQNFFFCFKSFVWKDFISLNSIFLFYKFNTNWTNNFFLKLNSQKFTLLISDNSNFFLKNTLNNWTLNQYTNKTWWNWIIVDDAHYQNILEIFYNTLNLEEIKEFKKLKSLKSIDNDFEIFWDLYFSNLMSKTKLADINTINSYLYQFELLNDYLANWEVNFLFNRWHKYCYKYELFYVSPFSVERRKKFPIYFTEKHPECLNYMWNLKESSFYFISKNLKFGFLNDIYILSYNLYELYFLLFWLSGSLLLISMLTVVSLIVVPKNKNN